MRTPLRNIRLSDEHWKTFREKLGMDWLRKQIEKADKKASATAVTALEKIQYKH